MTDEKKRGPGDAVAYPASRAAPPAPGGFAELGVTPLARSLGLEEWQLNGHWCSRCQGIWYGYTLEAQCPRCSNRHG